MSRFSAQDPGPIGERKKKSTKGLTQNMVFTIHFK